MPAPLRSATFIYLAANRNTLKPVNSKTDKDLLSAVQQKLHVSLTEAHKTLPIADMRDVKFKSCKLLLIALVTA